MVARVEVRRQLPMGGFFDLPREQQVRELALLEVDETERRELAELGALRIAEALAKARPKTPKRGRRRG